MPYDPNYPPDHILVKAADFRNQFSAIKGLIDACAPAASGVTTVQFADGDDADTKIQKLQDTLNLLVLAQGGQPPLPAASVGIHDNPARLEMSAPGNNPVFWVIESSPDESHWTDLATIDGAADTWAISDTSLYYRARGVDANGVTVIADSNSVLMSRDA